MEVVRKTVPSSGSGVTKAALSELGSAPRLGVGGGIGGSETRSIGGTYNCLNTVRLVFISICNESVCYSFCLGPKKSHLSLGQNVQRLDLVSELCILGGSCLGLSLRSRAHCTCLLLPVATTTNFRFCLIDQCVES